MPSEMSSTLPPQVKEALARDWTVLTGNQRAARTLRQAYNDMKRADGDAAWQPPAVFAWDTWLGLLWRRLVIEGRASALLLNAHQEHAVWRDIIQADEQLGPSLRSPDSLADLAAGAWELLNRFGARGNLRRYTETADTKAFARWVTEFERRASRDVLLSRSRLPAVLSDAFSKGEFSGGEVPESAFPTQHIVNKEVVGDSGTGQGPVVGGLRGLLLVGFDHKTPDQESLLASVLGAGIPVEEIAQAAPSGRARLTGAENEKAELDACARWVRQYLSKKPDARVAVIVPALADLRSRVDRTFREILAPELEDIASAAEGAPWEFSLGVTLASTPLVSAALDLLDWGAAPLATERASRLLLCPHLAGGGEYLARAEFDAFALRRGLGLLPEVTLNELLRLAATSQQRARLPQLIQHAGAVQRLLDRIKPSEGERSHAAWCAVFTQLLEAWGWTAGQPQGSVDFQTRRRWAGVLDELASLDFDGQVVSYATALKELRRMGEGTLFAPESRDAPVQVMGPLEAAGSRFDAVWFLGAGDLSWPAGAAAHPLLPLQLQRERGMPGADPAQATEQARIVALRVAVSAPIVTFSYARETPDSHQRPSPALRDVALEAVAVEDLVETPPARRPVLLEKLEDAEVLPSLPDRVVRGGSQILKLQAACGFRAFAENRLHSAALDETEPGLDAMERGNLVHSALERVWAVLGNQQALRELSLEERRDLLAGCIDQAMERAREGSGPWPAAYLDIERERLVRLLGAWLEKELERSPFAVALREERVEDVAVGPLRIEMRLDRVDVLLKNSEPAGEIVLDYKTGSVKTADWMGERPDDPQVPLYALVRNPESLVGVAFGSVRPGKTIGLSGFQGQADVLPSRARLVDLRYQVDEWREVLTALAEEYAAGNATVSPKQYPTTCRNCEQRLLCRLEPRKLEPENLEDLADPDWNEAEAELA